jgi:succinate dehydrogenase / fumarate reductase, cytochrome b subunit
MKFAYYPGCSARSTCAELNEATHRVAQRLGLELVTLESATCTGARELRAIDPSRAVRTKAILLLQASTS